MGFLHLLWKLKQHKWPGSHLSLLSENTFPGKGSIAMLRLIQWHLALPFQPPGSRFISSPILNMIKLNQPRPLASLMALQQPLCHSESHTVVLQTQRWDVGGREGRRMQPPQKAALLLLSCTIQSPPPKMVTSCGWELLAHQCSAVCFKETEEASEIRAGEIVLGKDWPAVLSDKTGKWWDRAPQPAQGTHKCNFSSVPSL